MSDATRLERATHTVGGERAELRLEDGAVTIAKEATTRGRPSSVTVPVDRVRGVDLHRPSRASSGWLHVAVVDGSPAPSTELAAMSDPYTIPITSRHLTAARRLERLVEDHVRRRGLPAEEPSTSVATSSGVVLTDAPTTHEAPPTPEVPTASEVPTAAETAATPATDVEPPPYTPPGEEAGEAPAEGGALAAELRELADLHEAGALTDEEFRRAKQRVLGG
jgi:hypothetical protein